MPIKVLVTGANGQLALSIKELYYKNNNEIEFNFVDKNQLDITKTEEVESFFNNNSFSFCINCAAYTNVEQAETETDLAFNVNAVAVQNLAQQCQSKKIVLIHISTDYVFDGEKTIPYDENDQTNPINEYGKSKLLGEKHIQEVCSKYFILRTSWLYSQFGKNFLNTIISKIRNDENLTIIDSQLGSPTSTNTVAEFCYQILITKELRFGTYHVTSSNYTSWFGFARAIAGYFPTYNTEKISPVSFFKTKAKRPSYSVLNNQKAQGIFPKIVSWEEDLKRVIKPMLK